MASATGILIDRTVYFKKYKQALREGKSVIAPENRLYLAMVGTFGVPIGCVVRLLTKGEKETANRSSRLFWFAWTARPSIHWIVPVLAGIPFAFGKSHWLALPE